MFRQERSVTLIQKLWITVILSILITILFGFILSRFFYEHLYVDKVENELKGEGEKLAAIYDGGIISNSLKEKIEWYDSINEAEIFLVTDSQELLSTKRKESEKRAAGYITIPERDALLEGKTISRTGYEPRIGKTVTSIIVPLVEQDHLAGIIYLYLPLATIRELTRDFTIMWVLAAILFTIFSVYFSTMLINKITKPLKMIEKGALAIAKGDYSIRIHYNKNDEIGNLAQSFNVMTENIQMEDERKREFLANVSHELRTPLSYMKGYSEAILDNIITSDMEKEKYLKLIAKETNRLQYLVQDLLSLTSLDDKPVLSDGKYPIAFSQLVEDCLDFYGPKAKEMKINLISKLDPDPIICGDESSISQVVKNLMDNAFQYTNQGGEITVRVSMNGNTVRLIVEDTGIGIPEEDLPYVTDRFYRVNKGRSRSNGGSGLGLSIVKKIIEKHDGTFKIKSELGKGTRVTVHLPLCMETGGWNH